MPTLQEVHWEKNPLAMLLRANLGELSIYQPALGRGQGGYPGFTVFYAGFLESEFRGVAEQFNILCF